MTERHFTITVFGHPTQAQLAEQRKFDQQIALRGLVNRCTTIEGYDAAVAMLEKQCGMALPDALREQSRQRIAQRLAQQEE